MLTTVLLFLVPGGSLIVAGTFAWKWWKERQRRQGVEKELAEANAVLRMLKTSQTVYRHFKGGLYQWITDALDVTTIKRVAVYRGCADGKAYVRPLGEFEDDVIGRNGSKRRRFEPLESLPSEGEVLLNVFGSPGWDEVKDRSKD